METAPEEGPEDGTLEARELETVNPESEEPTAEGTEAPEGEEDIRAIRIEPDDHSSVFSRGYAQKDFLLRIRDDSVDIGYRPLQPVGAGGHGCGAGGIE